MKRVLPLILLCACAPALGVTTPSTHPTAGVSQHSVGVSAGAVYGKSGDNNVLVLPHGEGWVRVPAGSGQVDFHIVSGMAALGYRIELSSLSRGGTGFALEPELHGSYVHVSDQDNSSGAFFIGAGLKALILVPTGSGFFYLAPMLSVTRGEATGDDSGSASILGLGGALGIDLGTAPIAASIELAVQRTSSLKDDNTEAVWLFVPTVGLRL